MCFVRHGERPTPESPPARLSLHAVRRRRHRHAGRRHHEDRSRRPPRPTPSVSRHNFEMYRVLHEILGGRLYATPELRKNLDSHSIDLQIMGVDWGIECMFEGRKLKDYVERFGLGGAYGNWC